MALELYEEELHFEGLLKQKKSNIKYRLTRRALDLQKCRWHKKSKVLHLQHIGAHQGNAPRTAAVPTRARTAAVFRNSLMLMKISGSTGSVLGFDGFSDLDNRSRGLPFLKCIHMAAPCYST